MSSCNAKQNAAWSTTGSTLVALSTIRQQELVLPIAGECFRRQLACCKQNYARRH